MAHGITIRKDGFAEAAFSLTPAWHGLGAVYDHPMTSKEALKGAGLDWEVVQQPVAVNINGEWVAQSGLRANVRADTSLVLGMVTDHYQVVQNVEAFGFLDELVDNHEMLYESAFSLYGGRKVVIVARMPGYKEAVPGDAILPYILLGLAHDGKGAITFGPVHTRVVCANTYSAALTEGTTKDLSIRHHGDIKTKLRKARDILAASNKQFAQYAEISTVLANRRLTNEEWTEFLNIMCPELDPRDPDYTERRARSLAETRQAIDQAFRNERNSISGMEHSAWAAFNAVCEHIDHLPRRGATMKQKAEARFNVALYGPGRDMKERAWKLAQNFAGISTPV